MHEAMHRPPGAAAEGNAAAAIRVVASVWASGDEEGGVERAPWIDALRILAACAVLGFHVFYLTPVIQMPTSVQRIACHGYLGVEVFFMISGYVISLSAAGRTHCAFARARLLRLWPAFL